MNTHRLDLRLIADPLQLSFSDRPSFQIGIAATNLGDEVIDPELHLTELLVNGRESRVWSLAIGNGKREARWSALPPGNTVSLRWSTLGVRLFLECGDYVLRLRLGTIESPEVVVRVIP